MEWNLISSDQNGGEYMFSGLLDEQDKGLVLSGEAMIGLNLGQQTYCHEKYSMCSSVKRSRASYQSAVLPRCQVEGCNLDLSSAKDYHRRHRICANHTKSPKIVVAGMERRFCQQCSRLHDLSEFDDQKRSCRRRLSAHNARRRRSQPEDTKLIGSTHRRGSHMGFLVDRVHISSTSTTPQSSSNFNSGCVDIMSNGGLSDISSSIIGINTPRRVNHNGLEANSSSICGLEGHHPFSMEAASSWSFRGHEEPSSFDQFIHGHSIGLAQPGMPLGVQSTHNTQIAYDNHNFCSN